MDPIELSDVQGLLINEYADMQYSRYFILQIHAADAAKIFISKISESITNATAPASQYRVNIAFTAPGLKALGLDEQNLDTFVREFREGMVTPHRQRLLGDFDSSAPEMWQWGGPTNDVVHILLMVFGKDQSETEIYCKQLSAQIVGSGLKEVLHLDGLLQPGHKEHFGFKDGISQPYIKGSGMSGKDSDNLNAGEFLMGYKSEYNVYPDSPLVAKKQGDTSLLRDDAAGSGYKDLGRNGTYLVIRQLQQHVKNYWTFLNENTRNDDGSLNAKASKKLAAKMMGRWPSGAPIVKWPDEDPVEKYPDQDPGKFINDNDFLYNETDRHGMKCPFGAHARRLNPRDSFEENTKEESLLLSNRHRIIRRTRTYGEPFIGNPEHFEPKGEVGLIFTCFNADISRQFEFIQYTWANYPKFKQLFNDPDPFIGVKENPEPGIQQVFTIPHRPANKYLTDLQRFITVRGGAYFFFPSITVIKYLATI